MQDRLLRMGVAQNRIPFLNVFVCCPFSFWEGVSRRTGGSGTEETPTSLPGLVLLFTLADLPAGHCKCRPEPTPRSRKAGSEPELSTAEPMGKGKGGWLDY